MGLREILERLVVTADVDTALAKTKNLLLDKGCECNYVSNYCSCGAKEHNDILQEIREALGLTKE